MLRIIILFFLVSTTYLRAQDYRPLVVENATWIYTGFGDLSGNVGGLQISGDTIVNDKLYKKVYGLGFETIPYGTYSGPFILTGKVFKGLIREDTISKKVYTNLQSDFNFGSSVHECNDLITSNEEFLLYDFDLSIGDSLNTCNSVDNYSQHFSVQDIYYEDYFGYNFKTFQLDEYSIKLIEGFGYPNGPFFGAIEIIAAGPDMVYLDIVEEYL